MKLSGKFTYKRLIAFTLPSVVMMVFTSIYGVVDGFFVSNFVGKIPFAAVNFIMPFLMLLGAIGFMFGTGGSALVAKIMGEGDTDKANGIFSFVIMASVVTGVIISVTGFIFLEPVARFLGAEGALIRDAVLYGRIIILANPFFILQMAFQSFFVTAGKPGLGLISTVLAGVTNMILDFVLMVPLKMGIIGAALATSISQFVGGVVPLIYFSSKNKSALRLGKILPSFKALLKVTTNGSSELMTNISMSLVNMLYNIQLLKYAGENGIAAYGVLMYVNFMFLGVFIGYSVGSAPVISYHFGAKNHREVKGVLKKSLVINSVFALMMFLSANVFADALSGLFAGYDEELFEMTKRGFLFISFSYLFAGFAIFFSGFFTALNDGLTSAILSFSRTLVFQLLAVIILPLIWGLDGIWISLTVAEVLAVMCGFVFLVLKRKKYNY
ncbi:MAG: MATE family efflux transporter [Ruminococcaceae bacterium]|nr:MATE family efflux transporter [Oscillospiraceae bacterium]